MEFLKLISPPACNSFIFVPRNLHNLLVVYPANLVLVPSNVGLANIPSHCDSFCRRADSPLDASRLQSPALFWIGSGGLKHWRPLSVASYPTDSSGCQIRLRKRSGGNSSPPILRPVFEKA